MGGADDRAALAAAQEALLAALVGGGAVPPGFDADRVRIQARALLLKRARTASAHHPWLLVALGEGYLPAFGVFAGRHPRSPGSHAHEDAAAFEAHLRSRGELPPRPHVPLPTRLRERLREGLGEGRGDRVRTRRRT